MHSIFFGHDGLKFQFPPEHYNQTRVQFQFFDALDLFSLNVAMDEVHISAVIFDLDGTLLDTGHKIFWFCLRFLVNLLFLVLIQVFLNIWRNIDGESVQDRGGSQGGEEIGEHITLFKCWRKNKETINSEKCYSCTSFSWNSDYTLMCHPFAMLKHCTEEYFDMTDGVTPQCVNIIRCRRYAWFINSWIVGERLDKPYVPTA